MRVCVILVVIAASLLISSGFSNLLEPGEAVGEILAVRAFPELLEAGKPEVFEVGVKNLGNEGDFLIEVLRDSQPVVAYRFKLNALDNKTLSFAASKPPVVGESNYTYLLYSGMVWGQKVLLGSVSEKRRVYSPRELSDEDKDGLKYYEEIRLGTEPGLADTDGDDIPDNLDPYPTQASGSLNITSSPEAEVYLDGTLEGSTPLYIPYVSMGLRKIEIIKEGYVTSAQMVSLKPGETLNLSFQLFPAQKSELSIGNHVAAQSIENPKNKFIYVASQPSGAEVFIDGVIAGTTPLVINAQQGNHGILFRRDGFNNVSLEINMTLEDKNIFVKMEPVE